MAWAIATMFRNRGKNRPRANEQTISRNSSVPTGIGTEPRFRTRFKSDSAHDTRLITTSNEHSLPRTNGTIALKRNYKIEIVYI